MEQQKELPLLISFSGGKTSAFMAYYLVNKYPCRERVVVFANTGKEDEETLRFVDKCDKAFGLNVVWVEAVINPEHGQGTISKVVNFKTASRNGEPFEATIQKYGIPSKPNPHCTRELKQRPIHHFAKQVLGWAEYETAIGIRADETSRLNWENAKKNRLVYPLATEFRVDKSYINRFWDKQPFTLNLKSYQGNCDLCYKKSKRNLLTLILENPDRLLWWDQMEQKYKMHVPESRQHNPNSKPPFHFFRENLSAQDLKELSGFRFEKAKDEHDTSKLQMLMFSDADLDFTDGCQSCEVA